MGNFAAFAEKFDFSSYKTWADIGGATGQLSTLSRAASAYPLPKYDLPEVQPIAAAAECGSNNLDGRVNPETIDFFANEFPKADIITMGMIFHDWNLENKKMLIAKAFRAWPAGGAFVAIENIIDNERRQNSIRSDDVAEHAHRIWRGVSILPAHSSPGGAKREGLAAARLSRLAGAASAAVAYK